MRRVFFEPPKRWERVKIGCGVKTGVMRGCGAKVGIDGGCENVGYVVH